MGKIGDGEWKASLSWWAQSNGIVETPYCTLDTNVTLYASYTGIKPKSLNKK